MITLEDHITTFGSVDTSTPFAPLCVADNSILSASFKDKMDFTITMKDKKGNSFDKSVFPPVVSIQSSQGMCCVNNLSISISSDSRNSAIHIVTKWKYLLCF